MSGRGDVMSSSLHQQDASVTRSHGRPMQNGASAHAGRPGTEPGLRAGAAVVLAGPVVLLLAIAYHPFIPQLTNNADVAQAFEVGPLRWGLSHLAVGVAAAVLLLSFIALRSYLRQRGDRWSGRGLPFIVVGTVLFAFLPAMEVAAIAVDKAGGDVGPVLVEMNTWFVPILLASSVLFTVGAVMYAAGVATTPLSLSRGMTWMVAIALVVGALARFVPLGAALFVGVLALILALWPLGFAMLQDAEEEAEQTH
jgi:hypothetical protein